MKKETFLSDPVSIGRFAALTGVDKETLRFYRDKGLLAPAKKEENGYTCYGIYDFMDLYSILRYRDMEMSIRQAGQLLCGADLDAYEKKLDAQIVGLEEELVRLRRKLFRIRNAKQYLYSARQKDKRIEYQEEGMALYTLWLDEASAPGAAGLLTRIPGSYIGIRIPLDELLNGPQGETYRSCIGVGISQPSVKEYAFPVPEEMEYTKPGPVLKYYLRLRDPLRIREEDMEELLAYSRLNGFELIDHTTGYLCGTERRGEERSYYFMIRVRVRRRAEGR